MVSHRDSKNFWLAFANKSWRTRLFKNPMVILKSFAYWTSCKSHTLTWNNEFIPTDDQFTSQVICSSGDLSNALTTHLELFWFYSSLSSSELGLQNPKVFSNSSTKALGNIRLRHGCRDFRSVTKWVHPGPGMYRTETTTTTTTTTTTETTTTKQQPITTNNNQQQPTTNNHNNNNNNNNQQPTTTTTTTTTTTKNNQQPTTTTNNQQPTTTTTSATVNLSYSFFTISCIFGLGVLLL